MIYVASKNDVYGVYLKESCKKGAVVCDLTTGTLVPGPTRTSIQVSKKYHVEDKVGRYINHSCNPTCKVVSFFVVSLRDIESDEEVTFNYNESESKLAEPFECNCCGKIIKGKEA